MAMREIEIEEASERESGMKRPERKAEEQSLMIRDGIVTIAGETNCCTAVGYTYRHRHVEKREVQVAESTTSRNQAAAFIVRAIVYFPCLAGCLI